MHRLGVIALVACHAQPTRAQQRVPDACDAIDAMLAVDNAAYQRIYAGCGGDSARRRVVDVRGPAAFMAKDARCEGHAFRFVREHPDVQGMVIRFDVSRSGTRWAFHASSYPPNPVENADGSFDVTQSYCVADRGYLEWTGRRWRAFVERESPLQQGAH